MKRLLVVCAVVLTLMASPCFAIEYCKDFLESGNTGGWSASLKTFDDEWTMGVGDEVSVDIWINDVPEVLAAAGFYLTYDPLLVTVEDVVVYDLLHGGPWMDGVGGIEPEPDGPGTYRVFLAQFACADPDGDGDIIIAKVTFKCQSLGDANITISTIPNFDTVVACSAYNYDPEIQPNTITIHQQQDICEGNFDGDQDVDGTDAAVFKTDFGRSPFSDPCPSTTTTTITTGGCPYGMVDCGDKCVDPMTDEDYCGASVDCLGGTTCGVGEVCNSGVCENCSADNNYEPCILNDDCDSGCCCDEGNGFGILCHNQTYCEEVLMRDCVEVTTSSTTTTSITACGVPPCAGECNDCCCFLSDTIPDCTCDTSGVNICEITGGVCL